MSRATAETPAFRDSSKIRTELTSRLCVGQDRSTFVSADRFGRVVLQHCGADLSMRATMPAAEARALAAELLAAAAAAEAPRAAA